MRAVTRLRRHEEDEESAFVSMTDMTVSFLFIVMILLAFFAKQFRDQEVVPLPEHQAVLMERDAARAEAADLATRLRALEDEIARLGRALNATEAQRDAAREEARALRRDLEAAQAEAGRLRDRIADLSAALERAVAERDAARLAAAALRRQLEELEATLRALRAELATVEETVGLLRVRVAELEAEVARLSEPDPLEAYLAEVGSERLRLLEALRAQLMADFPGLNVVISAEGDALRFQGEGLFGSASSELVPDRRRIVERIAKRLDAILPCYTLGERAAWEMSCNPGLAVIEAVQIEGHTDDVGGDLYNLRLSADRGAATYGAMTAAVPGLLDHRNLAGQAVLSVAGYGKNRPVATNGTPEGRAVNRRIDLRFIMFSPTRSEEIGLIRAALADASAPNGTGPQ